MVQCRTGVRSHIAASLLQKHGFTNIQNLTGGIEAWLNAGLPIESSTREPATP